ncbi:MAG TPA: hypothetical protein VLF40_03970 [Candidatus Saccharimonadales bacterium]|nr:hypothetical protein [Candidatus Saccharimonadales bacterium]
MIETSGEVGADTGSDYVIPVDAGGADYGGAEANHDSPGLVDSGEDTGEGDGYDYAGEGDFTDGSRHDAQVDSPGSNLEETVGALALEFTDSGDSDEYDEAPDTELAAGTGHAGGGTLRGLGSAGLEHFEAGETTGTTIDAAAVPEAAVTNLEPSTETEEATEAPSAEQPTDTAMAEAVPETDGQDSETAPGDGGAVKDTATVTVREREPAPEPGQPPEPEPELGETGQLIASSPMLEGLVRPITPEAFQELRTDHVWDLKAAGPDGRGFRVEDALAQMWEEDHPGTVHLQSNHPTIDLWDPSRGAATSVKSLDLTDPTYEDPARFEAKVRHYMKLAKDYSPTEINGQPAYTRTVREREVALALPDTGFTEAHLDRLETLKVDSTVWSILLSLVEIPR